MPNRWIDFVRKYSVDKNISWNCALCEIKEKGLYKPLNKQQQKEEEKQKQDLLEKQIFERAVKSFIKRFSEIKNLDDFNSLKNSFFNRSKDFQEKVKQTSPNFFKAISGEYNQPSNEPIKIKVKKEKQKQPKKEVEEKQKEASSYLKKRLEEAIKEREREREKEKERIEKEREKKEKEELDKIVNPDILSHKLQQLILTTRNESIIEALINLNYRGRLETNPFLMIRQILQNFNTMEKIRMLIKEINKVERMKLKNVL